MSDNKEVVLIGYSGHGLVVAEAALEAKLNLRFYSDKNQILLNAFNLNFLGCDADKDFIGWKKEYKFILGIGNNAIRQRIAVNILERKEELLTVIHPASSISNKTQIGVGVFISRSVSVNPLVIINDYVILNTGCIIEHGCELAKAVHIAPGAVLAGNVKVGERSFIGANAVVKQGIKIGKDVVVGAGSVVLKDIPDNSTYIGNPAKKIDEK